MSTDCLAPSQPPAARSGVIERATAVLDTFVDGPEWMGLDDISLLADIPRSTTFRLLRQLVALRWLEHGERGYRLGNRVRRYGSRATNCEDLRVAASTALTDLNLATGGVAHLGVLDGSAVNYLDRIGGAASATIPSRVGARLPATDTVSGLVLLAGLPAEAADKVIGQANRPADRIHRDLRRVRDRSGLAFVPADRCRLGITAIAAPISGRDGTVAAISLSIRRQVDFHQLAPLVWRAARSAARTLSSQHRADGALR